MSELREWHVRWLDGEWDSRRRIAARCAEEAAEMFAMVADEGDFEGPSKIVVRPADGLGGEVVFIASAETMKHYNITAAS